MNIDFEKVQGLIPAIIQDAETNQMLMHGYMDRAAYERTVAEGRVTFFSRSKQRLWTKGETSGNYLIVREILPDCDNDTLLIRASPQGPTCHSGAASCFQPSPFLFLEELQKIIDQRNTDHGADSYTAQLFRSGSGRIAQKLGEEATEVIVAALSEGDEKVLNEAADLMFHLVVLLRQRDLTLTQVVQVLEGRRQGTKG